MVGGALVEQVSLIDELLCSLSTMPILCELLAMLPGRNNTTPVPMCEACVVCGGRDSPRRSSGAKRTAWRLSRRNVRREKGKGEMSAVVDTRARSVRLWDSS